MADNLKVITCVACKCRFGIPMALYEVALCRDDIIFYCPYGHDLRFPNRGEIHEGKDNVVQLHIVKKDNDTGTNN